jgi:hypothetical protein
MAGAGGGEKVRISPSQISAIEGTTYFFLTCFFKEADSFIFYCPIINFRNADLLC